MATPYVVIRVVPESPVDGATFSTYLNNLTLQLFDAYTNDAVSDVAYASPLSAYGYPPGSGGYLSAATISTKSDTPYDKSTGKYGSTLTFESTNGISVGSYFYSADQTTIPFANATVSEVAADSVKLSGDLDHYVPAGTVVTFIGQPAQAGAGTVSSVTGFSFTLNTTSAPTELNGQAIVLNFANTAGVMAGMDVSGPSIPNATIVTAVTPTTVTISNEVTGAPAAVTFTLEPPFMTVTRQPKSGSPQANPTTLTFKSGDTNGIPVGAILTPVAGLIKPGTTVTAATATTLTLSTALQGPLPQNQDLTFNFMLSLHIAQHTESIYIGFDFFNGGPQYATIPAAVATAVLPLTSAQPDYLDIKIKATRGTEIVPVTATYYNVNVSTDNTPSPEMYQQIATADTSLYLALPPTPGANTINLEIPA
ncbi:hypothetical protein, partial [Mycobacterium sp.]|uniref:hypothetical protein n=1 Tax=Mycobacterium sp. TaxID=1785 RepID=UPI003C77571F